MEGMINMKHWKCNIHFAIIWYDLNITSILLRNSIAFYGYLDCVTWISCTETKYENIEMYTIVLCKKEEMYC